MTEPLRQRIETTRQGRDDIYTNRKFIAIMEHPDNADITRAIEVGLAINDPVREDEEEDQGEAEILARVTGEDDGLVAA